MALLNVNVYNALDPTDKVETNISFTNTSTQVTFNTSNAKGSKVAFPDISNFFRGRTGVTSFTYDHDFVDTENSFVNCSAAFKDCQAMTACDVVPVYTTNANLMYEHCYKLTGEPVCPDTVTDAYGMYSECRVMTGSPEVGSSVTEASYMYVNANSLTGEPKCPDSVVNANYMYYICGKLTGSPEVGASVVNANNMYYMCNNLTGDAVCPDSVVNAEYMYAYCPNLDGNAACGDAVVNAKDMYNGCRNLTGPSVVGASAVDCNNMYRDCANVKRMTNLPSTCTNIHAMYWADSAYYSDFNNVLNENADVFSGIYHWDCDEMTSPGGLVYSGTWYYWPHTIFNAAHIKVNQFYPGTTTNTKTFNFLKGQNCLIEGAAQTWNEEHKVLTYITSNMFFHCDPDWDYHEETAKIADIDRVEIDRRGVLTSWQDIVKKSNFLGNGEAFLFTECDRGVYGVQTPQDRPGFTIYYKDGTTKAYPTGIIEYLHYNTFTTMGRKIGDSALQYGLPHFIFSEMDDKYAENIYFSGNWGDLFAGATLITKFPVFQRPDGHIYDDCWGKVNNFAGFFRGCSNLKDNVENWIGWNAFNNGKVACNNMFGYDYNLTGSPVFHENITNMWDMYTRCRSLVGFNNIPNLTTDGVLARGIFYQETQRDLSLPPFAEGIYHCNYDNFGNVMDFFNTNDWTGGPSRYGNALHLYINKYYPGTTTLTKTYNAFLTNTMQSRGSTDIPEYNCMIVNGGDSNFWIHYDEDRDFISKIKPVTEIEILPIGNITDMRKYTQSYINTSCHNGQFVFAEGTSESLGDTPRSYGVTFTAHFDDGTEYTNRTYQGLSYANRGNRRYGWEQNQVTAFGFPWWVVSNTPGFESTPGAVTFSGDWSDLFAKTIMNEFPWSEEYGHNMFYKVTAANNMFMYSNFGQRYTGGSFDLSDLNMCSCTQASRFFQEQYYCNADFSGANFCNVQMAHMFFDNCKYNIVPPNLPNATNLQYFLHNCQNSNFDCTGYNFGIDNGANVVMNSAFDEDRLMTGELYIPSGANNLHCTARNCYSLNSVVFNSDFKNTAFIEACLLGTASNTNLSVYLPNEKPAATLCNGAFGWYTSQEANKKLHELHLYDPYYTDSSKVKTSPWWNEVSNFGQLSSTISMFWAHTGSSWTSRPITWTDDVANGQLVNTLYNIYYHYGQALSAHIPLPDDVKAAFDSGEATSFVTM